MNFEQIAKAWRIVGADIAGLKWDDFAKALAEQPVQKRPQNCGTGYCSCIECVMEPAQQEPGVDMKEASKLALEALESLSMNDYSGYEISKHETYKIDNAITAIKAALAQPAQQEPKK